ncbi:hypothetical protein NLX04_001242 [Escherichia coli]|nr:hypothetical protein [Escherichia coli]
MRALELLRVRARNGTQMSLVMTPCQTSAHNASCRAERSTDSPILSRIRWLICCANQAPPSARTATIACCSAERFA